MFSSLRITRLILVLINRCMTTKVVVSPSGELEVAPVPSGSGFACPSLLRRGVW